MEPAVHELDLRTGASVEPLHVVAALASSGLFADYLAYENGGTWSFAGDVAGEVALGARHVTSRWGDTVSTSPWQDAPLRDFAARLAELPLREWRAYGWMDFEAGRLVHAARTGGVFPGADDRPLLRMFIPRVEVRVTDGVVRVRGDDPDRLAAVADVVKAADVYAPVVPDGAPPAVDLSADPDDYRRIVGAAVADINGGELQKVILSRIVPLDFELDIVASYIKGRRRNTPARSFLLRVDGLEAAGFSPETVVEVGADGSVVSQPLAGTRALTADPVVNRALREELLADPKELFEHATSVRLVWDELAEVCAPGSVAVTEYMRVRERGTAQHLASRAGGRLAPGRDAWDALGALFPAVTASGIPKAEAYTVIERYETGPRGLYGGAVLTADSAGGLDAALVLRSMYRTGGRTWLRAGAGIVGASRPDREFEETCEKLRSVANHLVAAEPSREREYTGAGLTAGEWPR